MTGMTIGGQPYIARLGVVLNHPNLDIARVLWELQVFATEQHPAFATLPRTLLGNPLIAGNLDTCEDMGPVPDFLTRQRLLMDHGFVVVGEPDSWGWSEGLLEDGVPPGVVSLSADIEIRPVADVAAEVTTEHLGAVSRTTAMPPRP
ncbi:hypothetical protein [Streptomyces sp. NPDC088801]|uniref:hypothetical protein n=1 Tax=Streptomyces sp. NPDC088801 TaxID=3365903 RepID=UPI0037FDA8E1